MKIYPVFHISLLEQFIDSDISDRIQSISSFVIIKNQIEYEMKDILDSKILYKCLFYLVKWKNYSISNNSWEFAFHFLNSKDLIQEFHSRYSNKSSASLSFISILIVIISKKKRDRSKKVNFVDIYLIFYSSNSSFSIFFDLIIVSACV